MGNEIWVWRRVWDIDLTITAWLGSQLSLSQYSQISSHRSHWPGHTHLRQAAPETQCDPSCVCLTGDCNNHCIVTLVMIIINQSPQLLGVSPLLSCVCLVTPAPALLSCSGLIIITGHTSSDGLRVVTTSIVCPLNPPSQLARSPTPRHILSVRTWYLPIVKLFTTPTREGFYKINSTPLDDLPGCRNSDTLILPQKEFRVASSQQRSKFW